MAVEICKKKCNKHFNLKTLNIQFQKNNDNLYAWPGGTASETNTMRPRTIRTLILVVVLDMIDATY